jgi:hypothetical protein
MIRLGSPFWSYYALLALLENGYPQQALEYIRLCWGLMLEFGATSCWEMWDRHSSLCHGWSGAPAMILPAYVLGVQPLEPGFAEFSVSPRIGDLDRAAGQIPTPEGPVTVQWHREEEQFSCTVVVPTGTRGQFRWPEVDNGAVREGKLDGNGFSVTNAAVLEPGEHEIELQLTARSG